MLKNKVHARDIMTREAFENAIVVGLAMGGSTNLVLHFLALARLVQFLLYSFFCPHLLFIIIYKFRTL